MMATLTILLLGIFVVQVMLVSGDYYDREKDCEEIIYVLTAFAVDVYVHASLNMH